MGITRVLVVTHDNRLGSAIRDRLERTGYHVCGVASSGEQASARVAVEPPDIAVVDIALPAPRGGVEIGGEISGQWGIPVVFVGAPAGPEESDAVVAAAPFAIVTHPLDGEGLRITLELALHRARTEEEIRVREEKLRLIAEYALDWEFWMDPQGRFVYSSPSCESLTGHPPEAFSNDRGLFVRIVHPDDREVVEKHIASIAPDFPSHHLEYRIRRKDGELRWLSHDCRSIFSTDGQRWLGRRAGNRDITERKRVEEERASAQDRLARAGHLASLGILSSGLAHDISNPNHVIMCNASVLEEVWRAVMPILDEYVREQGDFAVLGSSYTVMKSDLAESAQGISGASRRIADVVERIGEISRWERRKTRERADINSVVRMAVEAVEAGRDASRSTDVDLDISVPETSGNAERLEMAITAVLRNAVESLRREDDRVRISTEYSPGDRRVWVRVKDSGVGIPEEDLSRATDPFFTTRRLEGRSGLGLSIALTVVESHGGRMEIASKPGEGTEVILWLPAESPAG